MMTPLTVGWLWNARADPRAGRLPALPIDTRAPENGVSPLEINLRPGPDSAATGVRITLLAVIVWIALVVWLGLVVWSLSVVRAAAGSDAPAPAPARIPTGHVPFAGRRRAMAIGQTAALAA